MEPTYGELCEKLKGKIIAEVKECYVREEFCDDMEALTLTFTDETTLIVYAASACDNATLNFLTEGEVDRNVIPLEEV